MTNADIQKIFTDNLNRLLETNDKTQVELAKHIGVSNTTINNYVKGYNMPRRDKIDAIANFFNVNRSDLINEHNRETKMYFRVNLEDLTDEERAEAEEELEEFAEFVKQKLKNKRK